MEDKNEFTYFHSPTYEHNEILCEGSDSEQTAVEVEAKRKRYEEQALRISRGQLPVILSAALKGPFDQRSGWKNPWRPRSRTQLQDEAGESGSSRGRTSDIYGPKSSGIDISVRRHQPATNIVQVAAVQSMQSISRPAKQRPSLGSGSPKSILGKPPSPARSNEQHSRDHVLRRLPPKDNEVESIEHQRIDISWLKGSYVSRRARWDDPVISSPSPLIIQRKRKKSLTSTNAQSPVNEHGSKGPRLRMPSLDQSMISKGIIKTDTLSEQALPRNSTTSTPLGAEQYISPIDDERVTSLHLQVGTGMKNVQDQRSTFDPSFAYSGNKRSLRGEYISARSSDETDHASSFITEVVPSCRDLEKFEFRKRRKLRALPEQSSHSQPSVNLQNYAAIENLATDVLTLGDCLHRSGSPKSLPSIGHEDLLLSEYQDEEWESTIGADVDAQLMSEMLESPKSVKTRLQHKTTSSPKSTTLDNGEDDEWETIMEGISHVKSLLQHSSVSRNRKWSPTNFSAKHILPRNTTRPALSTSRYVSQASTMVSQTDIFDDSVGGVQINLPVLSDEASSNDNLSSVSGCIEAVMHTAVDKRHDIQQTEQVDEDDSMDQKYISTQSANTTPNQTHPRHTIYQDLMNTGHSLAGKGGGTTFDPQNIKSSTSSDTSHHVDNRSSTNAVAHELDHPSVYSIAGPNGSSPLAARLSASTPTVQSVIVRTVATTSPDVLPDIVNSPFDMGDFFNNSSEGSPKSLKVSYTGKMANDVPQKSATCIASPPSASPGRQTRTSSGENSTKTPTRIARSESSQKSEREKSQLMDISLNETANLTTSTDHIIGQNDTSILTSFNKMAMVKEQSQSITDSTTSRMPLTTPSHPRENSLQETIPSNRQRQLDQRQPENQDSSSPSSSDTNSRQLSQLETETQTPCTGLPLAKEISSTRIQSPWSNAPTTAVLTRTHTLAEIQTCAPPMSSHDSEVILAEDEQSQWQPFEPAIIPPETNEISFLNLVTTPRKLSSAAAVSTGQNRYLGKQISLNPWASSRKTDASNRSKKRVSFGITSEGPDSPTPSVHDFDISLPSQRSPSPEMDYIQSQDTNVRRRLISLPPGTRDCFKDKKSFRRILPDKSASQLNSSPAPIEAMAEAFVTADDGFTKDPKKEESTSHHLRSPRQQSESPWTSRLMQSANTFDDMVDEQENVAFPADFDIEEALGEAHDFLEDWSVEAELKKARLEEELADATNPMRRRRLFGIA